MLALLLAVQAGYVDPASCRPCHSRIFDAYLKTGMGRSFSRASQVPPLDNFAHAKSQRSYSVIQRDGAYWLRRAQPELERTIDYVIGSGNHSQTFVHRNAAGRLIELPLSWYAGKWAMSPGYDRPDHSDFRREVTDSCLFCHNGYPSAANAGLASGIDCQRCHGPGEAHVKRTGAIANPGRLDPARSLEVCLQCHLESASRTLPEAVRRPGRGPFSFRPGEPLGDYKVYFEFAKPAAEDRITVNGAGYGLLKSRCFIRSEGRLQCTACHDPHGAVPVNYTQVCRNCHQSAHEAARQDCTGCHMPKRRTEDAVHVVMTDHLIRKRPPSGDPLAPIEERHDKLTGPVRLLYPAALANSPLDRLIVAMAGDDARALQTAIVQAQPQAQPEPFLRLAELFERAGRRADAVREYRNAIAAGPTDPAPYAKIADASALARFPNDVPLLNTIAVVYAGQSRFDEALALMERAVRLAPDDPVSWLNLGVCMEAKGNVAGAFAAYTQALALQPGLTRARTYLARLKKEQ
jgi:hypothetical protein